MFVLLLACQVPAPAVAASEPPPANQPDPALDAAKAYSTALRARLQAAMGSGGPAAGIDVCTTAAPAIAAEVATTHGVRLGRSSLRLRNPANAGPDWVQAWLRETGERPAAGLGPSHLAPDHLVVPIVVEPVCLACHGDPATLAPETRAALAAHYPQDRATGYAVGDLRGVLWVETGGGAGR